MTRMTTPPPVSRMIQASRFRTCSNTRSPTRLRRNRMQPTCPWTTSSICVPASRRRSSTRAMSPTVLMLCTRRNVRPSRRSMPTSRNSKMHSPRSPWFRKPSWPRTSPATCSPTPQRRPRLKLRSRPMRPIPLMRLRPMPRWLPSQPRQPLGPWKHPMTVTRTT